MSIANLVTAATHCPTPHVIHGDYFRVRIFWNGNLHLWFERKDLLVEVNKLLAEYYGEVIGDGYDTTEAAETPDYHMTPAKNFGAFMSSEDVAAWVMQYAQIGKRSEEHTSELQSLMRNSYAAYCLKKKTKET